MLLGEGRDVNLLMGLKTSFDTVLLSSSCVFLIFTPVKEWRREEVVGGIWTI